MFGTSPFIKKNSLFCEFYFFVILVFAMVLPAHLVKAQGASNKGTDFWLLYAPHVNGYTNNAQKMSLYITSEVNTSGKVEIPGINYTTTFTVQANKVTVLDIPQNAYSGGAEGKNNKGIHLTSLKPIVAYGHIYNSAMSGATLLLPTNTLGKDYYSINFSQRANSDFAYSFCAIVATEDNTQVVITPAVTTQGGLTAGVAKSITLNKGEVYQIFGKETSVTKDKSGNVTMTTGDDLTGTTIKSVAANGQTCKRIAVFSGSTRVSIGCASATSPGSADNLFQQVYPTSTWGKTFITAPTKDRFYDVYRVFKSNPTTTVKLNGTIINPISFVNNLYYEFSSDKVNYIEADNSIQVVQYAVTQSKNMNCTSNSGDVGDPEMIFLNPLEQTLNKMTMYSSSYYKILKHYINVVIKTADVPSFKLDGQSKASLFLPVTNKTGYSYAQLSVSEGTHNLEADGGFNAIAYGFGANESYGYAAGASLISPGIEAVDQLTQKKAENGCINDPYNLFVSLPYTPLKITADFDDGLGNVDIPLDLVETYSLNNIQYNKYRLITNKVYATPKKYLIKVATEKPAADGCGAIDNLELEYEVLEKPSPSFEVANDKVCKGQAFQFTDKSDAKGNTIVKWYWDFGDGNTSVKTNADPFSYTHQPGTYTVKLSVENQAGCLSLPFTKTVQVLADPIVQFKNSTPLCEKQLIQFEDQSSSTDGQITAWRWDFGDGQSATVQNPSHIFTQVGEYDVKLTLTTQYGCEQSLVKKIKINPVPQVDFELPDFCLSDARAVFVNKSSVSSNETLSYFWDFGDPNANAQRPNTSTDKDGKHVYTQSGIYEVTLIVKTASSCQTVLKKQFRVNGSTPKAAFEVLNSSKLCSGSPVHFKDLSTVDFGELTRIEWYFDYVNKTTPDLVDENPELRSASPKIYSFTYPAFSHISAKSYTVKMRAFSGGTCVSETTQTININPLPQVDFELVSSCLPGGMASFINKSTFINGQSALSYLWDFGDPKANAQRPNQSTASNPTHLYSEAGKYQVTLTVQTSNGCSVVLSKEIDIAGAVPLADFIVDNQNALCVGNEVVFNDKASLAFGNITRIDWYFDYQNQPNDVFSDLNPGDRSAPKSYRHQYPVFNLPFQKEFIVRMQVYSGNSCLATVDKKIVLHAMPVLDFPAVSEYCLYAPAFQLYAKESNNMPGVGYFTGKGVSSTGFFDPIKAGVGTHTITYNFSVTNGCTLQKSIEVVINEIPVVDAGEDLVVLEGGQAIFKSTAFGDNLSYKWSPSTGLDRDDVLNPTVFPLEDTKYTLKVISGKGCISQDEVFVKVLKNLDIPNTFSPNGDGVNDTWNIKYIDSYPTAKIEVFDRNGQKVFSSIGYSKAFDGKFQGKDLPLGTYFYVISLHTRKTPITGSLLIIR